MQKTHLHTLVMFTFLLSASAVDAAVISATLDGDTYIRQNQTTSNFDTNTQILLGNNSFGGGQTFTILLSFDLAPISGLGSVTINSVTLTGNKDSAGNGGNNDYDLYDYSFYDLDTSVATWNNPDGQAGGDTTAGGTFGDANTPFLSSVTASGTADLGTPVVFGTSAAFVTAVEGALSGSGVMNLLLTPNDPSFVGFMRMESLETSGGTPFDLQVDYTVIPEPSSLALLGLAASALLLFRRRT